MLGLSAFIAAAALGLVPTDAKAALRELERFGNVGPCRKRDRVEARLPTSQWAPTGDHSHRLEPPEVVPRLRGKAKELLPYADHSSVQVVRRAVELLCATGDRDAIARIQALARRFPCHDFLRSAEHALKPLDDPNAAKPAPSGQDCGGANAPDAIPGLPADWTRWRSKESEALAIQLDAGERAAVELVLRGLDAMRVVDARNAAAALATVSTRAGFVALVRAFTGDFEGHGTLEMSFATQLGPHLLANVSRKEHVGAADLLVALVAEHGELEEQLWGLANHDRETTRVLTARAPVEARRNESPLAVRAFYERFELQAAGLDVTRAALAAKSLDALLVAKNAPRLAEAMRDRSRLRNERLLAGAHLLRLGRAEGLEIFEDAESVASSLAPLAVEELRDVAKAAPPALGDRLTVTLALYQRRAP